MSNESNQRVLYKVCDVRNTQDCVEAVRLAETEWGRLDILINGAAGNFLALASDLSPKGFATVINIDTIGTFNMSRAAYRLLASRPNSPHHDGGIIINISATLQYGATHWQAHASAAKAAVDSLTRSLALEWGEDKIRVVGIAPGPIADTPGTTKLAPGLETQDIAQMVTDGVPLGRMGETWEIGFAAVYLCTAKYVTGDTLVVDGGQWLYKAPMVPKTLVAELSRNVEARSRNQRPTSKL